MDDWVGWLAAGVVTMGVGMFAWVGRTLTKLPTEFVPRDQINSRFEAIRQEMRDDTEALERRNDKRFDEVRDEFKNVGEKLDRILDKVDRKADK